MSEYSPHRHIRIVPEREMNMVRLFLADVQVLMNRQEVDDLIDALEVGRDKTWPPESMSS